VEESGKFNQIMDKIIIPSEATKYILFQRTQYLRFANRRLLNTLQRLLPFSIYNIAVLFESKISKRRVAKRYQEDMEKEFEMIKKFLPKECSALLDIGCGVAGIDVLLGKHYEKNDIKIFLLDKTKIEKKVWYGFRQSGAFYNSLPIAKKVLLGNGINDKNVVLLETNDRNEIHIDGKVDLVLSLISWGFHYPVETYLDRVYDMLSEGGSLIIDIRKSSDGVDKVSEKFSTVSIIREITKYDRVLAIK